MNQGFVAGHLGADPEVRFTSSGKKVTSFRVGARARNNESIWWRVSVWGEQFDKLIAYLKEGSSVMVFGEIQKPEIYTDKEGQPQISLQITANNILFSPFGRSDSASGTPSQSSTTPSQADLEMAFSAVAEPVSGKGKEELPFSDEDLPF